MQPTLGEQNNQDSVTEDDLECLTRAIVSDSGSYSFQMEWQLDCLRAAQKIGKQMDKVERWHGDTMLGIDNLLKEVRKLQKEICEAKKGGG